MDYIIYQGCIKNKPLAGLIYGLTPVHGKTETKKKVIYFIKILPVSYI